MSSATRNGLWWAGPTGSLLLVVPGSIWLAASTSDLSFRLLYRTPKVLTNETALLFSVAGAMLLLGVVTTLALRPGTWSSDWPALSPEQVTLLARASDWCFWLTVAGYASFALAGVARGVDPGLLIDALTSQSNYSGELKATFAPVTGVTTLTQVGIAYVVLAGLLLACGHRHHLGRRIGAVLVLALVRSFFLTERLAVLEVLLPIVLLIAVALHRRGDLRPALAPVLALPALVVVFGAFEYSRSWTYFRARTTASYPEFVLDRLAGYYATAYNNGAIGVTDESAPGRLPYASLEALWTAPGAAQVQLYQRLSGGIDPLKEYAEQLEQRGNPEFNNPCGLCSPLIDFGVLGGLLVLLLAGLAVGAAWCSFRDSAPFGLLLYPLVFTGLLELPRYLYWTQGRLVPPVIALLAVAVLLRRAAPARAPATSAPLP